MFCEVGHLSERRFDDLCVVVACRDEADNVGELCDRVEASCPGASVLLVDDGSSDGTWDAIRGLSAACERVFGLRLAPCGYGQMPATQVGLRRAYEMGFGLIAQIDADMQEPPESIPEMVGLLESRNVSQVVATRSLDVRDGVANKLGSGLYSALSLRGRYRDLRGCATLKVMRADVVRVMCERPASIRDNKLDSVRWYGDFDTVCVRRGRREHGVTKWSVSRKVRYALECFVTQDVRFELFAAYLALVLFLAGVCLMVACIARSGDVLFAIGGMSCLVAALVAATSVVAFAMLRVVVHELRDGQPAVVEEVGRSQSRS